MNQSISSPQSADHRRTLGAVVVSGGVEFRVWAPKRQRVVVVCAKGEAPDLVLQRDAAGYFTGTCPHRKAGANKEFNDLPIPDDLRRDE